MKNINLALIYGGISEEREVSLKSGKAARNAIKNDFNLKIYDPKKDIAKIVNNKEKIDLAFPILHGKYGEDGTIQGFLDMLSIPYVGSGCLASAIGMDKQIFKQLLKANKLKYPQTLICKNKYRKPQFSGPWFVKPNSQGSSVGISRAKTLSQLKSSFNQAKKFDQVVHIEKEIVGQELTCGVIEEGGKTRALPIVEIIPQNDFFDYQAKYDGSTKEIVPAKIDKNLTKKVQDISLKVFKLVKARDFARIDFIVNKEGKPHILEINTIPGMTSESLLPKEAKAAGYSFREFLIAIIQNSWQRNLEK